MTSYLPGGVVTMTTSEPKFDGGVGRCPVRAGMACNCTGLCRMPVAETYVGKHRKK